MDILRKELDRIYQSQNLDAEYLDEGRITACKEIASNVASATGGCCVITDAARDYCYLYAGGLSSLIGLDGAPDLYREIGSSDEDVIYTRLHPEDLVEKRMLEYEFFRFVDPLPPSEKKKYKATCRIRVRDREGNYIFIDNSTQIIEPSPGGKIWLILCCYDLSPLQKGMPEGINAHIKNNHTGEITELAFGEKKSHILSDREKEILRLVSEGKLSKQIAGILGISVNTVNRHRQNILEKLSVVNSYEAITAARAMGLL